MLSRGIPEILGADESDGARGGKNGYNGREPVSGAE